MHAQERQLYVQACMAAQGTVALTFSSNSRSLKGVGYQELRFWVPCSTCSRLAHGWDDTGVRCVMV